MRRKFLRNPGDDPCQCGHARMTHANDLPWERSGGSHCRRNECPCQAFELGIVTARGTQIRRFPRTGVGKRVGDELYFHRLYVPCSPHAGRSSGQVRAGVGIA
jgi:hypothetical protein